MEDWDRLEHLGHERPTPAVCDLVAECMTRVGATSVRIEGKGKALARGLRVPVGPDGDLVVAMWDIRHVLEAVQRKPKGILALGPRPATLNEMSGEHLQAYYETIESAGYVSVQRWSLASRCHLDI